MFLALWEFEVKPGCEERFEKVHGANGDWAMLFRTDSRYRETRLLHDPLRPAVYLTLDFWMSRQACEEFLQKRLAEYKALDATGKRLTIRERRIGWYETLSA
jgi:hypothetical protein